jgi:hypothetical protein
LRDLTESYCAWRAHGVLGVGDLVTMGIKSGGSLLSATLSYAVLRRASRSLTAGVPRGRGWPFGEA